MLRESNRILQRKIIWKFSVKSGKQVHDMGRKTNKIDIEDLAGAIVRELHQYSDKVDADVKKAVRKTANSVRSELVQTSPKETGDYAKSWKSSLTEETGHSMHITVYAGKYQIAHLLENGHALRRGGRTIGKGYVSPEQHIKTAEEHGEQLLTELIEKVL